MNAQQQAWESLRLELIARIALINAETPWQEVEPEWWLQMIAVQRAAIAKATGADA